MIKRLTLIAVLLLAPGCVGGMATAIPFTPAAPVIVPAAAVGGGLYLLTR